MRRFMVRMVVETNEDPKKEIYYSDEEMAQMIAEWTDQAFEDRDDHPQRVWTEITVLVIARGEGS